MQISGEMEGRTERITLLLIHSFFFVQVAYFAGNYSRLDWFLLRGERLVIAGAGFMASSRPTDSVETLKEICCRIVCVNAP